jgi:hypothetical protein
MEETMADNAAAPCFWETNLRVIRRQFPGLAEQLEEPVSPPGPGALALAAGEAPAASGEWDGAAGDIRLEYSAAGLPVLLIRGLHIHSNRDPEREGRRLAESLGEGPPEQPLLVLGFGLGYGAEAAAVKTPERPLVIVERHVSVLRKALESRDLSAFLGSRKIVFVLGGTGEGVTAALGLFDGSGGRPLILRNRALISLNEGWFGELERQLAAWAARGDVNQATLRRFGKRWVRNLSRNMGAIRDVPGISRLEGLAAPGEGVPDIPVFLAAAGPSLDTCAPILGEIQRRCLVVAVDTSLRFLLKQGIDPDFVLSVDPQYWNSRHLDRSPAPHTYLVAESAVYPSVLRHPFRGCFLCGSLFPLGYFIEDRVDPKGRLGAGGSVATTAWDFARSLGARQIWIAGLDLAYPGLKTHFRGALFEDRSHAESGRRSPAETWSVRALRDGQPFKAPAGSGTAGGAAAGGEALAPQVLTDHRLSLYASWFENRFRQFPELRSCRLFPGGLAIRGLEESFPAALTALPDRRDEIDRRLARAFARVEAEFFEPETARRREERYLAARAALFRGLETIKTIAEGGAKTAEQALHRLPPASERRKILTALDASLKAITQSEVKDVAGFLFPPPEAETGGAAGGSPAEKGEEAAFRSYLKASVKLYRALAEAAGYNLRELTRVNPE